MKYNIRKATKPIIQMRIMKAKAGMLLNIVWRNSPQLE